MFPRVPLLFRISSMLTTIVCLLVPKSPMVLPFFTGFRVAAASYQSDNRMAGAAFHEAAKLNEDPAEGQVPILSGFERLRLY
jgi:hypothetical protein